MKAPCYRCTEREEDCHTRCEKYLEYKELVRKATAEEKAERKIETDLLEIRARRQRDPTIKKNRTHRW